MLFSLGACHGFCCGQWPSESTTIKELSQVATSSTGSLCVGRQQNAVPTMICFRGFSFAFFFFFLVALTTIEESGAPTAAFSSVPSSDPGATASAVLTEASSKLPSSIPSNPQSVLPMQSSAPSIQSSEAPSTSLTITYQSVDHSSRPIEVPFASPTDVHSAAPSESPTITDQSLVPSSQPTQVPSASGTDVYSAAPSASPTITD